MRERLFLPSPDSKGNPLLEWIRQMKEKHPKLKTVERTIDGGDIRIVIDLQKETARVIGPRNSATMNATLDWFVEQVKKQVKKQLEEDTGGT